MMSWVSRVVKADLLFNTTTVTITTKALFNRLGGRRTGSVLFYFTNVLQALLRWQQADDSAWFRTDGFI
jgi:hypothetical protein